MLAVLMNIINIIIAFIIITTRVSITSCGGSPPWTVSADADLCPVLANEDPGGGCSCLSVMFGLLCRLVVFSTLNFCLFDINNCGSCLWTPQTNTSQTSSKQHYIFPLVCFYNTINNIMGRSFHGKCVQYWKKKKKQELYGLLSCLQRCRDQDGGRG